MERIKILKRTFLYLFICSITAPLLSKTSITRLGAIKKPNKLIAFLGKFKQKSKTETTSTSANQAELNPSTATGSTAEHPTNTGNNTTAPGAENQTDVASPTAENSTNPTDNAIEPADNTTEPTTPQPTQPYSILNFHQDNPDTSIQIIEKSYTDELSGKIKLLKTLALRGKKLTTLKGITSKTLALQLNTVELLDLQDNHLLDLSPTILKAFKNLKVLLLTNNDNLQFVPSNFAGLASLEELRFNSDTLAVLPDDLFKGLANLKILSIKSQSLSLIPPTVFNDLPNLQIFHLSKCPQLQLLTKNFEPLTKLQRLYLTNNNLTQLPTGICFGLSKLNKLVLTDNKFTKEQEQLTSKDIATTSPKADVIFNTKKTKKKSRGYLRALTILRTKYRRLITSACKDCS